MTTETLAQVGESWGGYTILEVLGHLGLAERYRVRGSDGKIHLLDVIAMQHPALLKRLREADLGRIEHPNLLAVTDVVSVLRFPGIVCANTAGIPLEQWRRTEPSLADRLRVARDIAAGLEALHAAGSTHGFLQPSVILVERRFGRPRAKVGLLGVASVVFSILKEGGSITTSGSSLGGIAFQSPEQQRTPSQTDHRSDLFSFGCILYYLLAGESPFAHLDPLSCFEAARTERYAPITSRVPDLPADGVRLLGNLLRPDPVARPSAGDARRRLDTLIPQSRGCRWIVLFVALAIAIAGLWLWL